MRLAYANWKMAQPLGAIDAFAKDFVAPSGVEVAVFPSYVHLSQVLGLQKPWLIGAQDCSTEKAGAFTGEVSAQSLKELGVTTVLIGHSERRQRVPETQMSLSQKLDRVLEAHLKPVFCVGETLSQRNAGQTESIVAEQLEVLQGRSQNIVVAYEPVWAIGTGLTPQNADIQKVHSFIWSRLPDLRAVLYGGSVKPENAKEIASIQGVTGFLVGGASLSSQSFHQIAASLG